jgi:hypothetical protein
MNPLRLIRVLALGGDGMIPVKRLAGDFQTVYECPLCLFRQTVHTSQELSHTPEGTTCLQRQITSLQETVARIMDKLGGEL